VIDIRAYIVLEHCWCSRRLSIW